MKKLSLLITLIIAVCFSVYAQDKYSLNRDDLPEPAREFLTEHFPKAKVGMIKTDRHFLKKTDYDVKLVNGTKIEFNNSGKWTSVDCNRSEVPDAIIPRAIRKYVRTNYPDVKIVKIERTSSKYEIGLSDDVELTFNLLGQFKGVKISD